jgi:FtsP/CotA-like multicopper oxidase with cupredoxin domain
VTDSILSRRELLARAGIVAGGAVLLGCRVAGTDRALAAPQTRTGPAGLWPEPAVRASSGGRMATRLRVAEGEVEIARAPARAVTYESSYPGPTLDVRAGDTLSVNLINGADTPTNLHTHGLHVSPRSPSDNVLLDIAPGERFGYRYEIPPNHPGGTFWYHAHRHELSDNQVFAGLFGMLIVRGELDEVPGVGGVEERAVILSQTQIVDGAVADADTSSLGDQVTVVNGRYQPALAMTPGQTLRLRVVNASVVFQRLELEGHTFHVIAFDGNALARPEPHTVLELVPGGRADVLLQATTAGTFPLRSLSWADFGAFYAGGMVPVPQLLGNLVVSGPDALPASLPTELLPVDGLQDASVDRRRVFVLEEREPRGTGRENRFEYYINGLRFDPTRVDEQVPLDATEEWEFRNLTYEPHPVHIHVNPFQVVAVNGDRTRAEPFFRDTALVPPYGSLTIRHRFVDFTGPFVMHCHILFHEDHGMMQIIDVYGKNGPGPRRLRPKTGEHAH